MGRSKWLLILLIPMLFGFDTRNPFRTRGPFKAYDFTIGGSGACVDGLDCFCDTFSHTGMTLCEDWENPQWIDTTATYNWAKAPSGQSGFRGGDGLWQRTYGGPNDSCNWTNGQPAVPTYGPRCEYSSCGAAAEWRSDDFFQGNSRTCMDFIREGNVNDEVSSLTLTGGHSGEVFDGEQSFSIRVAPGRVAEHGSTFKSGFTSSMGMTLALAYSSNLLTAAAPASADWPTQPWKWDQTTGGMQFPGGNTGGDFNNPPFSGGNAHAVSEGTCDSLVVAADLLIGNIDCQGNVMRISAARNGDGPTAANEFDRSDDWALGTWGCVRAYWSGHKSSTGEIWIEFQGPNDASPRRIFHIQNLDLNTMFGGADIGSLFFDGNYNGNDGLPGSTQSTETFNRYYDNVVLTTTEPPSCAAIGF